MKTSVKELLTFVRTYGGHTVDPVDDQVPTTGYVVTAYRPAIGTEVRIPLDSDRQVYEASAFWLLSTAANLNLLAHVFIECGEVVFELVEVFPKSTALDTVLALARERLQEEVYDLDNLKAISTGLVATEPGPR